MIIGMKMSREMNFCNCNGIVCSQCAGVDVCDMSACVYSIHSADCALCVSLCLYYH